MFGIGGPEMMIVFVIALLLFGKNLPQVARSMGKGMMEFKKGLHGFEDELDAATRSPSTPQSRPAPRDERADASAPKFEPPKFEPSDAADSEPSGDKPSA